MELRLNATGANVGKLVTHANADGTLNATITPTAPNGAVLAAYVWDNMHANYSNGITFPYTGPVLFTATSAYNSYSVHVSGSGFANGGGIRIDVEDPNTGQVYPGVGWVNALADGSFSADDSPPYPGPSWTNCGGGNVCSTINVLAFQYTLSPQVVTPWVSVTLVSSIIY